MTPPDSASPGLEIQTSHEPGVCVLSVVGELVVETASKLEAGLGTLATDCDVVLDVSLVPFMDSSGLRTIWSARTRTVAAARRFVLVVTPDSQVEGLMDFTELKGRLHIAATREQALSGLRSG